MRRLEHCCHLYSQTLPSQGKLYNANIDYFLDSTMALNLMYIPFFKIFLELLLLFKISWEGQPIKLLQQIHSFFQANHQANLH